MYLRGNLSQLVQVAWICITMVSFDDCGSEKLSQCSHCCTLDGTGSWARRPEQRDEMRIILIGKSLLPRKSILDSCVGFTLSLPYHGPPTPAALQIR